VPSAAASGALGTAAPGQAQGVMPPQVLGGPVWWYFVAVYLIAIALAIFVAVDTLVPARASRRAEIPEPSWLYGAVEFVYLVCAFGAWLPAIPRALTAVPVGMTPVAIAFGVAYLLRVVYPKPPKGPEPGSQE
jgi:hypothetical protein